MHKLLLTVLCALTLATPTRAQTTIDAAGLPNVTSLDAPWRFQAGDDPAYAAPTFDDSAWPLLKPNQPFADAHLPNVSGGYVWLRLRLPAPDSAQPLAIALTINQVPYQVFANGTLLFTSSSFAAHEQKVEPPEAIALPQSTNILLAVRVFVPAPILLHRIPVHQLEVAPLQTLVASTRLQRLRDIDENGIAGFVEALLFFALAPIPLTLYLFQRRQPEYLALAVFAVLSGIGATLETAYGLGAFALSRTEALADTYLSWLIFMAMLEFVARFALVKKFRPIRIFQAFLVATPLLIFFDNAIYNDAVLLAGLTFVLLNAYLLVRAWRGHRTEARLLMPPIVIWAACTLYPLVGQILSIRLPRGFHLGPVGISLDHVGSAVLISGVVAVVLYRFIRVSREEQRAASEFEAARTVQHVLIPDAKTNIPGLKILSAYHPAQSVGGDFFQILPLADQACLIVLGDVAGKGLQAAMAVSVLVGAVRSLAIFTTSPAEVLGGLNRILSGRQSSFTTCLALYIAANGQVTVANAGHLHPYLNGQELALEPNLPLGFGSPDDPASAYTETHFFLGPEDTLTLLTDGVPEAANPHTRELFGFHRTQNISGQSPQTIANTAQAFGQNDDITVLSLSRIPA